MPLSLLENINTLDLRLFTWNGFLKKFFALRLVSTGHIAHIRDTFPFPFRLSR